MSSLPSFTNSQFWFAVARQSLKSLILKSIEKRTKQYDYYSAACWHTEFPLHEDDFFLVDLYSNWPADSCPLWRCDFIVHVNYRVTLWCCRNSYQRLIKVKSYATLLKVSMQEASQQEQHKQHARVTFSNCSADKIKGTDNLPATCHSELLFLNLYRCVGHDISDASHTLWTPTSTPTYTHTPALTVVLLGELLQRNLK